MNNLPTLSRLRIRFYGYADVCLILLQKFSTILVSPSFDRNFANKMAQLLSLSKFYMWRLEVPWVQSWRSS
jgi:hypothetical protein